MEHFIINVLFNPMPVIGAFLSIVAALAFLVLLRGFLSGVMYLFTLNGNDDFLLHARIRVLWGFMLLVFFWSVWEIARWVYALFTNTPRPGTLGIALFLLLILGAATWGARFLIKKKLYP